MKINILGLLFVVITSVTSQSQAMTCAAKVNDTVQKFVGSTYDKILQSQAVQTEFSNVVASLKERGFIKNAEMIERLGFLNDANGNYTVTFESLITKQRELLAESIKLAKKNGDISKNINDALKLGIVFHKVEGFNRSNPDHWISLEPHEVIPAGYKIYENPSYLPGAALWSALSRGHFPALITIGSFSPKSVHVKAAAHDLIGHLPTYLLNVNYSLNYMKVSKAIIDKHKQLSAEHGRIYWSFIYKTGLFSRVYVFNEGLTQSRTDVILKYHELFGLAKKQIPEQNLSYKDLIPQTKDLDELSRALKFLVELTPEVSIPVGGATLVSTAGRTAFANYITYIADVIYPQFKRWREHAPLTEQVELTKSLISIIRGYHLSMNRLDFNKLAEEIFQDAPTPGSAMSHFFGSEADFYNQTRNIVEKIGLGVQSTSFGENALLYRFTAEGWNNPLPANMVKAQ